MDVGTIIAISGSTIAIVGVMIALIFFVRQESNSLRSDAKEDRKDFIGLYRESERELVDHRKEMAQVVRSIELEMKDFHYKLLEIERNRKAN